MRVLHIIDSMGLGGAQFLVKGIFEKYQNPDFHLFVLRKRKILISVNHPNVFFSESKGKYSIKSFFELKKYIKKNKIEVLHCYLLKSQIFAYILKRFFFRDIKVISHELGSIFSNETLFYKKFIKIAKKHVSRYLAASEATKQELIKRADIKPETIIVMYNYIILDNFKRDKIKIDVVKEKERLDISPEKITLGFAGRLHKVKGCEYLIKSLAYIENKVKLLIAGSGNEEKNLKQIIQNESIEDKVVFLGFVKDMMTFYPLIDILVIPSEHESFGLIAIEAQALGIPVIAANVPGLNEVVLHEKTGLLFEPENPKDLSKKIDFLVNNSEFKEKIIENSYANANKYSIEKYYKKNIKVYEELSIKE